MLTRPNARNNGMSFKLILKPLGSFMRSITAKRIPAIVSLKQATWIDVNPRSFKWRTKIPMLPQNNPAMIISMFPVMLFDLSIEKDYNTDSDSTIRG